MMIKNFKIAGIGELLWDVLPNGKELGGAPCNFAFHAMQTGCEAYVVSCLGEDKDGKEIMEHMNRLQMDKLYVQTTSDYPTGTVTVKLDEKGQPDYTIHEHVAWDNLIWTETLKALAGEIDAVCFGSLAQRNVVSRETIQKFIESTKTECLRVFDINLRQSFYTYDIILKSLQMANVLKLNEDELPEVANYFNLSGDEESILNQLLVKFELQLIAYTKGSEGSLLMTKHQKSYCDVPKIKVADTVGAGDSFTAILLAGMLNKTELRNIHKTATTLAAFVCTQHGATPKLPDHLPDQLKM